jgi:hypothetical protein
MKRFVLGLCLAVVPAIAVCLVAAVVAAQGSEGRTAVATARASTSAASFCADLQTQISSQSVRFSGWRCQPGPTIRGRETILAWVILTSRGGRANLALIWLAKIEPVVDAPVIDLVDVPRYGYEPDNVRRAFRTSDV